MTSYSLADLTDLADVTPRTVRYYIAQGLLRSPTGAGSAARYDDGHLYRLRLIRKLQRDHLPLGDIRRRLAAITDDEVERLTVEAPAVMDTASEYIGRLLANQGMPDTPPTPPTLPTPAPAAASAAPASATSTPSAPTPRPVAAQTPPPTMLEVGTRSQWERVGLDPDVELHIRRPLTRDAQRRVDRLIALARQLFEEDPS